MTSDTFFTEQEHISLGKAKAELMRLVRPVLREGDEALVDEYLGQAISSGKLERTEFGHNPILEDMETALVVAEEIGHFVSPVAHLASSPARWRTALLAVVLSSVVGSNVEALDNVRKDFGEEVAKILRGLLRIKELYDKSASIESDNFRSLLVTLAEDMWVILIIIANRVWLMRQIRDTENKEAQRRVATEAACLYAPLAHKLGLYKLKSELEDLSLKYLDPQAYYHIKEKLNETKKSRDAYIESFITPVEERLRTAGLKFHIKGRTKSIHSIWQKMGKQKVDVEGVFDLFAIRVILESEPEKEKQDCWQTFSIITDMYQSNPRRMRDWLSVPKSNGYESLHITVLGPGQKWVEVQIRTQRMDDVAEHGLAAHWRYKGVKGAEGGVDEWLGSIRAALENNGDGLETMDQLKMDLVEDEVFVFTPKGDLFKLPVGATVLDFAYAVHTDVGNHCTGAKIGGKIVTLKNKLRSGDQVEILTSNSQSPKQDWLSFVSTSRARSKIRQSLKGVATHSGATQLAKELLERKMRNRKIELDEPTLMHTIRALGFKVVTEFYQAIAEEKLDVNKAIEAYLLRQRHDRKEDPATQARSAGEFVLPAEESKKGKTRQQGGDTIVIGNDTKGLEYKLAKCCNPIYGDEVFGFVSLSGAIKIHRQTCPNARQMCERYGYRIVKASWAGKGENTYAITLHVVGNDDMGIVNNITSIISKEEKIQMRSISISSDDGLFSGQLTVMLEDLGRLQQLIKKLKTVKGVKNITRA
ncbi:MAG: RelA/SpoT family protein [Prevotellaceae bacterium]|nr:RelA/SpoT family protein [Prevotellaceae bacterium]